MSRVVLDAGARADLQHHLDVEVRTRLEPLRLEQLSIATQHLEPLAQLLSNRADRTLERRARCDEVFRRIDGGALEHRDGLARERIDLRDTLDLVAPELHAQTLLLVRGQDFDRVPSDTERAALECHVVAAVLNAHQSTEDVVPRNGLPLLQTDHSLAILDRIAEAVNRGHRRDDDDILPLHETGCGAQPEPVDVLVDRRILLDVRIARRHVGLGLIVVVVRDEVLDRVVREEALELTVELGRERLVVRENERRTAKVLDDVGHRHRLPGPGDPEQRLESVSALQASGQLRDSLWLVTRRLKRRLEHKLGTRHGRNIMLRVGVCSGRLEIARQAAISERPKPHDHHAAAGPGHLVRQRHRAPQWEDFDRLGIAE